MRMQHTKKLVTLSMLAALAYVAVFFFRIPVVLFLKYEPKDVVLAIGGFLYGPLSACALSVVVSLLEMVTISGTGVWGCLMNIISSCSFAGTAALFYRRRHTLKGAVLGLFAGWFLTVPVMLLWNYLVTPIYTGYPRATVAQLLLPAFLPFNLLKGGLNASITLLLYKPVVGALRRAKLAPPSQSSGSAGRRGGVLLAAGAVLVSGVLLLLALRGNG